MDDYYGQAKYRKNLRKSSASLAFFFLCRPDGLFYMGKNIQIFNKKKNDDDDDYPYMWKREKMNESIGVYGLGE